MISTRLAKAAAVATFALGVVLVVPANAVATEAPAVAASASVAPVTPVAPAPVAPADMIWQ